MRKPRVIMAKSPNWEPPRDFEGVVLYPEPGPVTEPETGPKPGVGWCSQFALFCKDPKCEKNHFTRETIGL